MKKKVVYTCLVGNYDELEEPLTAEGWEYICFSNDYIASPQSVWKVKPITFQCENNVILSRYPKLLPHEVLADYEYSVYVDANIKITKKSFYEDIEKLIDSEVVISIAEHTQRNCVYKEVEACYKLSKESYSKLKRLNSFLKNESFPIDYGLHENNIILRRHNDPDLIRMNKDWMNIFCNYAHRDQLSLEYVAWKNGIKIHPLFNKGFNPRNSSFIEFALHRENFIQKLIRKFKENRNTFLLSIHGGFK